MTGHLRLQSVSGHLSRSKIALDRADLPHQETGRRGGQQTDGSGNPEEDPVAAP